MRTPTPARVSRRDFLKTSATLSSGVLLGFRLSGESMIELSQTEDFWEGPKAFIEKRDPVWKGK